MSEDQGRRLAELIAQKATLEDDESDRRKEYKRTLDSIEADIARLADAISSGQADLFEEEEDAPQSKKGPRAV